MNKRLHPHLCGLRIFLVLVVLAAMSIAEAKPNIVFILADDLDTEIFSKEERMQVMLGDQGATFRNHFVSLSLCCPSRVATLRGQYAHNTGVYTNTAPDGGFGRAFSDGLEQSTVATWLQAAGYRTGLIGKYLNGYPDDAPIARKFRYIPPGWDYWVSPNRGDPYYEYLYALNENGTTVGYGNAPNDYLTDVLTVHATNFIRESANQPGKPFFLYLTPYAPHAPATPPPRYEQKFRHRRVPHTVSFNESDVSDKPDWIQAMPSLSQTDIREMNRLYRRRRRCMLAVEDLVGNVLATLRATGQLDNTYVFFASDNGFHMGQHRLPSGKNTAFEEDIRVPLVVRGPGVPAGLLVDEMTANVDYAPTFAAIAGVTPPSFVDGRSLLPLLSGKKPGAWRKALLLEHKQGVVPDRGRASSLLEPPDPHDLQTALTGEAPDFSGLRTADLFTYVEYVTGEHELYDLGKDPAQLTNVYNDSAPKLKTKLSAWLSVLRGAAGDQLRRAEEVPP